MPTARATAPIMIIGGLIALAAALALMIEKIALLENPFYVPACSLSEVLTCTDVMTSRQSEAFGFPNPLLGLMGFGAVTAFGAALASGAVFSRRLWLAIQAGMTFAVIFVLYLFVSSVYSIKALCPYCMVVWVATITIFVYVTTRNVASGVLPAPRPLAGFLVRHHLLVLIVWQALLTIQFVIAFWDRW